MKLSERVQQADTNRRPASGFPLAEWESPRGHDRPGTRGDNKRGYVVGFKGCTGFAEFTGFAGFTGFGGLTGRTGFRKAAVVAGATLALAVVGGQGSAQAQAQDRVQVRAQAQVQAQVQTQVQAMTVVDPIVERVCRTPLPVRLPLCGEPGTGTGTDKPVNGWQVEKPKQ